jgi:hypothetical protein
VRPGCAGSGCEAQSRTWHDVTVMSPAPSPPTVATSTVNSVPPVVGPHGAPSSVWSTVYEPPPFTTTWNVLLLNAESQPPGWMLAAGVPGVHNVKRGSRRKVTVAPRAAALSPRW